MRKKVGIVTIISKNLGNRLQNYALQEYLKTMDLSVKTIPIKRYSLFRKKIKACVKHWLSTFYPKYQSYVWDNFDQMINWETTTILENADKLVTQYDFFVAGSDQIWNPLFKFNSEREFLTFAKREQRIAYAASFGLNEIPEEYQAVYSDRISEFSFVSVREERGAEIIKELIHQEVPVLLDPTMLLEREKWEQLAQKSVFHLEEPFVIKYFLGIRNESYDEYIEKQAGGMSAQIFDVEQYNKENGNSIGPCEFINLVMNSKGVFTDSFHGTVFSILFHKPFVVFERPDQDGYGMMSSRLDTLLKRFNLERQRVNGVETLENIEYNVNFSDTEYVLKEERKRAEKYFRYALGE